LTFLALILFYLAYSMTGYLVYQHLFPVLV